MKTVTIELTEDEATITCGALYSSQKQLDEKIKICPDPAFKESYIHANNVVEDAVQKIERARNKA
jgi:hypothetical protein